ncbi:MAG: DUF1778 domain-containing protein [Thermovirgaceae bacterium]|nr:DUF1778 domain-containing protein [Thermovirgaceae bacterium]
MDTSVKNRMGKKERIEARIPGEMKDLISAAAKMEGRSLSDFVISSALSAARDVVRANAILELSKRDQALFAKTMITPPAPKDVLAEAAGHFTGRKNR